MSRRNPLPRTLDAGPPASDASAMFRSVAKWLKALVILVIGSSVLLGLLILRDDDLGAGGPDANRRSAGGTPATLPAPAEAAQGPWGRLTYVPIAIAPPLEFVRHMMPHTDRNVIWHFPNMISERLPALFSEIGLPEPLREKLVSLAEINPGIEGLSIHPTREIVLGLSPEDRSALYGVLAESRENIDQRGSFQFCGDTLDEWIGDSPLMPETRKLIEPLIYRYGSFLFFSDMRIIEESLPSPEQRSLLVEALSHESTFMVRLELPEQSDLEELIAYWGCGGRKNDVRPILESLRHTDQKQSIDVTHLLPPFARRRLYTYEAFSEDGLRRSRDCHWTALNFFADRPDDRYCDIKEVVRALKEDHYHIYGNLRLGDLVAFFDDQMRLIHSAVFVADDILFTKNGPASFHPWMFIKLEDMKYFYPGRKELQVHYFRRKDL